jgi:hypothetical protein
MVLSRRFPKDNERKHLGMEAMPKRPGNPEKRRVSKRWMALPCWLLLFGVLLLYYDGLPLLQAETSLSLSQHDDIEPPTQRQGVIRQFDLAVPVSGQRDKLIHFARRVGMTIEELREKEEDRKLNAIQINMVVTRFHKDDTSEDYRKELMELAKVPVRFAKRRNARFSRSVACNILHQSSCPDGKSDCVLAVVDVDMRIGTEFIENTITILSESIEKTAYFPIVFSQYNPEKVDLVRKIFGGLDTYSEHAGLWRDHGYGMYAVSKDVASRVSLDEEYYGWGGEDGDFYDAVEDMNFTMVRKRERGLIHVWHDKNCDDKSFVTDAYYDRWYV